MNDNVRKMLRQAWTRRYSGVNEKGQTDMQTQTPIYDSMKKELPEVKVGILNASDRCDSCGAQAYFRIKLHTGTLYFCGHHGSKVIDILATRGEAFLPPLEILNELWRIPEND